MGLVSKDTGESIRNTKAYKDGEAFLKSKEFKKLRKDNIRKFKNFDKESPEELMKVRDHMYHELGKEKPGISLYPEFIIVQIGVVAEKYKIATKEKTKENQSRRYRSSQVTVNPYAPLPTIPYGTNLRA